MLSSGGIQEGGLYKDTVDLPQTNFNMKANAVQREPEIQKLWEDKQIPQKIVEKNTGVCVIVSVQLFSLHAFEVVANVEDGGGLENISCTSLLANFSSA